MADHDRPLTIEERRAALIVELREKGVSLPPPLEHAFLIVPRHLFVPGVDLDVVYSDKVIVTRRDAEGQAVSSSSQPAIMAIMLDALDVREGQHALEIGAGTGYNAALLAVLVGDSGRVTTIEIDEEIAEAAKAHLVRAGYSAVDVIVGDGGAGYLPGAPYDRIVATASLWDLPPALLAQLKTGGVLVAPLCFEGLQVGAALCKQADGSLYSTRLFPLGFISLKGIAAPPEQRVRIYSSALSITMGDHPLLDAAGIHILLSENHELTQLPLELDTSNLGFLVYYLLFHEPGYYALVTYQVAEGQTAYGLEGVGWGVLSPTSACFVPYGDERVVHLYGGGDAFLTLAELSKSWQAAGQPGTACGPLEGHLHVAPAGQPPFQPPPEARTGRVFQRPAYTFTLWL